jgi:hypothetical protein
MSLIVTSSNQTDQIIGNIANEKPFSYRNYFKNGLRIKKDSQIAVQSVKFNREAFFDIGESDTFGFYFGDELGEDENIEDVTSRIIPVSLIGDIMRQTTNSNDIKNLTFSPLDYASHLEKIMSDNIFFPDAIPKGVKVNIQRDVSSKSFKGFEFTFDQTNDAPTNSTNISASVTSYWAGNQTSFTYATNTFTRTAVTSKIFGKKGFGTAYEYPLGLNGGVFSCSLTGLTTNSTIDDGWRIGLSRPTGQLSAEDITFIDNETEFVKRINSKNEVPPDTFNHLGGFDHHFYDFVVQYQNQRLLVLQNVRYGTPNKTRMRPIDYTINSSFTSEITNDDFDGNGWNIQQLRFIAKGEQLELELYSGSAKAWRKLISPSLAGSNKLTEFIPLNMNRWFLFPRFHLKTKNDSVKINTFNGVNISTNKYEAYFNRSFYTLARRNTIPQLRYEMIDSMDLAPISDISKPSIEKTLTTLNASNGTDFKVVLFLGKSNQYRTSNSPIYDFSITSEFGFDSQSIIEQSVFGTTTGSQVVIKSVSRPIISSDKSIFVRCNNLTFDSFNGATSSVSKILMALPKFDNRGSEFGALFYDSKELIFLDLNNSEDFILSDLSLDLINIDERFARGITGNTIITLVIKNK